MELRCHGKDTLSGVPVIAVPIGWDQYRNAAMLQRLGSGEKRTVHPNESESMRAKKRTAGIVVRKERLSTPEVLDAALDKILYDDS